MTQPAHRFWSVSETKGVVKLALARPELRNALDAQTIQEGIALIDWVSARDDVRVVVLSGEGTHFCAGADLNYMKKMRDASLEENEQDAVRLGNLFGKIASCPKPVIARVHGAAMGGGSGLVAAADISVAAEDTVFAFTEVRLGIIPAVISPYLIRRMGAARLRRAVLTGYRFDAEEALRLGLIDAVAPLPLADLDRMVDEIAQDLLAAGPKAVTAAKQLLDTVSGMSLELAAAETARRIARIRCTPEAQEGMASFLEKRKPSWVGGA
jgi:methylglutaconyl-CoA hydratase